MLGGYSMIEGSLRKVASTRNQLESHQLYAVFDSRTGEQVLLDSCDPIADGRTDIRPPAEFGAGGQLTMLEGFRGVVNRLSIENMRFVPSGTRAKGCGGSGKDIGLSEP